MSEVVKFENEQFGEVRTVMIDGEPWFVAVDVCKALGIRNPTALSRLDDDERSTLSLTEGTSPKGGNPNVNVINESGLYTLAIGSRKPEAKLFKRWIMHDVIPSIWRTGTYSTRPMSQIEIAQMSLNLLLEQERRLAAQEQASKELADSQRTIGEEVHGLEAEQADMKEQVQELKNHISHPNDYYSVSGYCNEIGKRVDVKAASRLGRKAARESQSRGYQIYKINDPRFGTVNTYHSDILKTVVG